MRIVSLIASATEIVHALGLGPRQVGRSHECDYPAEVSLLPICSHPRFIPDGNSLQIDQAVRALVQAGSVYEIDYPMMERLRPTHIVTQSHCRVCAVSREEVERTLGAEFPGSPSVVTLEPNCLADVWADIRRIAKACEVEEAGERLVVDLERRMEEVRTRVDGLRRPKVVCIEWIEPLMPAGNWMPELVDMAGGVNLFTQAGQHTPQLDWGELVAADPDVIVVSPCGFDLERTEAEMHWMTDRAEWSALQAVRNGRVHLIDGNQYMNRPGPRLVETLEILADCLHPGPRNYP